MSTISEMLNQSELIRESLYLVKILVFRYARAFEMMYDSIIPRINTSNNIYNVMYFFQDFSQLRDFCIEA